MTPHAPAPVSEHKQTYLGDGLYLTFDGFSLSLSGSRLGEHAITLRPAIFKRLLQEGMKRLCRIKTPAMPLLARLVERSLPTEDEGEQPVPIRTIPLLFVTRTRDEEMAEWEATLRRKREALAKAKAPSDASPRPAKPISELA